MPSPYDLLSSQLDDQADPDDLLRNIVGQDQGKNLVGGPEASPDGQIPQGAPGAQPVAPSPNVAGPLAALARKTPGKPQIRLLSKKKRGRGRGPAPGKPHIKLKASSYDLV